MISKFSQAGKSKDLLLTFGTAAVLIIIAALILVTNARYTSGYYIYTSDSIYYETAIVTAVINESLEPSDDLPGWNLGTQEITVLMKNGAQKGQEVRLTNILSTTHNINVRAGQSVIIKADRPAGIEPYYSVYNYDRTAGLIVIAALFAVLMFAAARFKGLRSVLGLAISLFFVLCYLLPAIYRGQSPIAAAIFTVAGTSVFSLLLLYGYSRKTLTAITATVAGTLLSAVFYVLLSAILKLSGYNAEGAEELILVSRNTGLQIGQVLFVGVMISSLGAVLDVTISIAASLYEIKRIQPGISSGELFRSGITVGQDVVGTMSQTLILAFVGSAMTTLLVLISYGTRIEQFISSDYVAVEVVHGITGSFAVIAAVPITSGLCVLFNGAKTR